MIKMLRLLKAIEKITNHDVKAVEYFLREKFDVLGIGAIQRVYTFWIDFSRYK
jgi:adenylosuccinate lyase